MIDNLRVMTQKYSSSIATTLKLLIESLMGILGRLYLVTNSILTLNSYKNSLNNSYFWRKLNYLCSL